MAKLSLQVQHALLTSFGRDCSRAAIRSTAACLQQIIQPDTQDSNLGQDTQRGTQQLGSAQNQAARRTPSSSPTHQQEAEGPPDSLHVLHCVAAVSLLGEAASSAPHLQPAAWDVLWPVLQAQGALPSGWGLLAVREQSVRSSFYKRSGLRNSYGPLEMPTLGCSCALAAASCHALHESLPGYTSRPGVDLAEAPADALSTLEAARAPLQRHLHTCSCWQSCALRLSSGNSWLHRPPGRRHKYGPG